MLRSGPRAVTIGAGLGVATAAEVGGVRVAGLEVSGRQVPGLHGTHRRGTGPLGSAGWILELVLPRVQLWLETPLVGLGCVLELG